MSQLAETWLAYEADLNDIREREGAEAVSEIIREESDPRQWSAERVNDIGVVGTLQELWYLVQALCSGVTDASRGAIVNIGADPLEEMIARFGDDALDLVQQEIGRNAILREALRAVWVDEPLRTRINKMVTAEHKG